MKQTDRRYSFIYIYNIYMESFQVIVVWQTNRVIITPPPTNVIQMANTHRHKKQFFFLSLSHSLTHTHTHIHTYIYIYIQ